MATNRQKIDWKDLAIIGLFFIIIYGISRMIVQFLVALVQELYLLGKWIYLSTKQCLAAKKAKEQQEAVNRTKLPPHDPES